MILYEGTNVDNDFPRCFDYFVDNELVPVDVSLRGRKWFYGVKHTLLLWSE